MREMKDSGIEWIGEIPNEWRIGVIKNAYSIILGKMLSPIQTHNEQTLENYLCAANIKWSGIDTSIQKKMWFSRSEKQTYILQNNDVVIMEGGLAGTTCLYKGELAPCYIQNSVHCCRAKHNFANRFLYYWMSVVYNSGYVDNLCNKATIQHYTKEKVMNTPFVIIPFSNQKRIADYLDRKCSQIDAIIARQQEIIEKLKAYKLSVITEAVTKGLNPDASMKDSGVEWIGQIPAHWEMVRLKFLLSQIVDCPHETPIYSVDGDYLVIRTADQELGKLRADENMYRLDESEYQNRIRRMPLEKDDIVYGREGERWGLACLVPESNKYCLGQRMLQFRCKSKSFLPRFAMWALNSKFVYLQGAVDTIGSTSPHVNISTVRNFLIPVPKISEQQKIAEYVDKKILQLDKETEYREILVQKLNDYKKSLIYEVVTGKKEV